MKPEKIQEKKVKIKKKLERESIGIKNIDIMIEGGLPSGSIVGLSGPPGVGKSILTLHFLLEGARIGQKSLYINLEEPLNNINNMISQFDFAEEFFRYVKEEKIILKCFDYMEYEKIYTDLFEKIQEDKIIKRIVIDTFNCFFSSISNYEGSINNNLAIRKMINQSFSVFRSKNMTTLLVLEMQNEKDMYSYSNIFHLVDGLISLDFLELGTIERRIFIPKMRWTNQYKESKSYEIGKDGIYIIEDEE